MTKSYEDYQRLLQSVSPSTMINTALLAHATLAKRHGAFDEKHYDREEYRDVHRLITERYGETTEVDDALEWLEMAATMEAF